MIKSKLKTGMKVVTKAGHQFTVLTNTSWGDGLIGQTTISLNEYRDDLRHKEKESKDIVEVYENWHMTNIKTETIKLPSHGYTLFAEINSDTSINYCPECKKTFETQIV